MTEQMLGSGPNTDILMQEIPMPPEPPISVPLIFIIFVSSVFVLTVLKYIEKTL